MRVPAEAFGLDTDTIYIGTVKKKLEEQDGPDEMWNVDWDDGETTKQSSSWLNEWKEDSNPGAADGGNVARAASATDGRRKGVEVREKISGRWGNWDLFDSQSSAANNYQNRNPRLTGPHISNMLYNQRNNDTRYVPQDVLDKYEVRRPDGAPQAQVGAAPQKKAAPAKKRPPPSSSSSEDSSDSDEPAAAPTDTNQTQFNETYQCRWCKQKSKSAKNGPCSNLNCRTNTGGGTGTRAAAPPAEPRRRTAPAPAPAPPPARRRVGPTALALAPPAKESRTALLQRVEDWIKRTDGITAKEKGERFERFMAFFMRHVPWDLTNHTYRTLDEERRPVFFDSVEVTQGSWDGGQDVLCKKQGEGGLMLQCKNYANAVSSDLLHTMLSKLLYSQTFDASDQKYAVAVAAVYPRFANKEKVSHIERFATTQLSGYQHAILRPLEWFGEHGIKARLDDFIRGSTSGSNVLLLQKHLREGFHETSYRPTLAQKHYNNQLGRGSST